MDAAEKATVIGKSVRIVGDISGSENLLLEGELEGSIQLSGARLTLGPAARVRADVIADAVVVYGRLEGDIRCAGRVELRASAMMLGNIYAHGLSIEENAAFRGVVDPSRAQEPLPTAPIAGEVADEQPQPEAALISTPDENVPEPAILYADQEI